MTVRSKALGVVVLIVLFVGIFGAGLMGLWKTRSSKNPARLQKGRSAGEYDPADIRGSYAFGEISDLFDIPQDLLARAFRLPADADPVTFMNKDLESLYTDLGEGLEIGTASMQLFVAYYKDLPYTPGEDTYLLKPAVNILKTQADLTPEQVAYLDAHTIEISAGDSASGDQGGKSSGEEHSEGDRLVRGKTMFADLLDWGLTEEQIEAVIGGEMPNKLMLVRDYCTENGLSFGIIKAEFQAMVDQIEE